MFCPFSSADRATGFYPGQRFESFRGRSDWESARPGGVMLFYIAGGLVEGLGFIIGAVCGAWITERKYQCGR